jgi:putative FmdB family regulatory protein
MPIYEYKCKKCGVKFEELVTNSQDLTINCPACGDKDTEKLMSAIGSISMGKSGDYSCASSCAQASSCAAAGGGCCGGH